MVGAVQQGREARTRWRLRVADVRKDKEVTDADIDKLFPGKPNFLVRKLLSLDKPEVQQAKRMP